MPNDGAGIFSAAANNVQHVEHRHPNGSNAAADEYHATNVQAVNEHGGIKAATNNVWYASQFFASAALPNAATYSPHDLPATVSTTVPTEWLLQ